MYILIFHYDPLRLSSYLRLKIFILGILVIDLDSTLRITFIQSNTRELYSVGFIYFNVFITYSIIKVQVLVWIVASYLIFISAD